jgi:diadenosine tetraphosphate (Ap4A) HIT family hydrolase
MTGTPPAITLDPVTIIESGDLWTIALNRNQNLVGKTMLVLGRPCNSVTELREVEWSDLHRQLRRACTAIDLLFAPDLYNHAFLMNEDRQVHLHIVPRYKTARMWEGEKFEDPHWGSLFGSELRSFDRAKLIMLAEAIRMRLPPF